MLNRWLKMIEQPIPSIKSVINTTDNDGMGTASVSVPIDLPNNSDTKSELSLMDSMPNVNVPFRKKAITSIERTRKLSILLKHQRHLVSDFYFLFKKKKLSH